MKQNITDPVSELSGRVDETQNLLDLAATPPEARVKPTAPDVWRVFIVAYNRLLRESLGKILSKRSELKVIGQSAASSDVVSELVNSTADILLLNSGGNLNNDLLIARMVRMRAPGVRIMMLGMSDDPREFLQCVRAGIAGYVLRDASSQRVLESVQVVCRGGAYCDGSLCKVLFNYFEKSANLPSSTVRESLGLTQREQEFIPLLARGASNKEIADQFCLSEQTVKNHLYRMKQKVGAANRTGIVHLCRSHGLNV